MTNKPNSKTRSKKTLETTLGKAPSYTADEPVDLSHIRKPIETSIFGLNQVLRLFETATDEVQRYVAYECDLIYECRICRTIFRSLANFILHKRSYCTESYKSNSYNTFRNTQMNIFECDNSRVSSPTEFDNNTILESSATSSNIPVETRKSKKKLSLVLNRLYDKQESSFITEQCLSEEVSNESQNLDKESAKSDIALQKLNSSNAGVYQTIFSHLGKNGKMDFMKTEVMEIHNILENNEAILGIDGKVLGCDSEKNPVLKNNYLCSVCNHKFSTKKTLTYHIRYKHNNSRLIYPCTECKETFANAWCVFRHLYKVHQKSTTQVRKLRNLIHDSAIKRSDETEKRCNVVLRSNTVPEKTSLDDQQWMNNLESDNDLQRCGGCGRKFERKAALHSHSQFCAKRIAVCNSLKENNNSKKIVVEDKSDKVNKPSKIDVSDVQTARRRKPLVAKKVQRLQYYDGISMLEEIIGPLPYRDNSLHTNNETDVTSCTVDVKEKSEDTTRSEKSDTFFIGAVTVSKVPKSNNNENLVEVVIENHLNVKNNKLEDQDTENDKTVHESNNSENIVATGTENHLEIKDDELSIVENKETKNDISDNHTVINVDDDTKLKQEVENNPALLICTGADCANTNAHCNSELKDNSCTSLVTNLKDSEESVTISPPKPKLSLENKSSKYVDIDKQTCLPCKKPFSTYKSLMKHMALHFNWYRYQCNTCKYLSYTKSKCKHHIVSKHNISDKTSLSNTIKRISRLKAHENATNFIKHYKRKKTCVAKTSDKVIIDKPKLGDDVTEIKTDVNNDKEACDKIQDPLIRQMVMEVIFGTPPSTTEETPMSVLNLDDPENLESSLSEGVTEKEALEPEVSIQDSFTSHNIIAVSPSETQPNDFSRPIRTRIMPLHKDFLYDMKHTIKLRDISKKRKKRNVKQLNNKAVKCSKMKVKNLAENLEQDANIVDCVPLVNTDINFSIQHVTGDVV